MCYGKFQQLLHRLLYVVASVDLCFRNTHGDRGMASLRRSHAHTHHLDEWKQADFKMSIGQAFRPHLSPNVLLGGRVSFRLAHGLVPNVQPPSHSQSLRRTP